MCRARNPLWIDATDRYAQLGQLPMGDQGRLALIASADTTALMKTPESTSKDNGLVETREFTLTDNGPANVVEITEPRGDLRVGLSRATTPTSPTRTRATACADTCKRSMFRTI